MSVFQGLEPHAPLSFFEQISAVPRGSCNEQGIADWLEGFARQRGLWCYRDASHNVLIKKPGQQGGESAAPLMLQGHSDIVCEKNQTTVFDFERDGLRLVVEDGKLRADGTTLGNDDGYALAYMLAVLDDRDIPHPPLECLFTSMEEIGLIGAQRFDFSQLAARRLIGMDGGREGQFMIGSAGGMQVTITTPAPRETCPAGWSALAIGVRGLQGGHSGALIHMGLGNANSLLGRILRGISKETELRIAAIGGGDKDNAIPRESDAVIVVDNSKAEAVKAIVSRISADIQAELQFADSGFRTLCERAEAAHCLTAEATARALSFQHLLPTGVVSMSRAIEGLTESSRNFASVKERDGLLEYVVSVRSATDSLVYAVSEHICHLAEALGGVAVCSAHYPAYSYNPQSPLRDMAAALWREFDGTEARLEAAHGGTELGVFSNHLAGLDIITLGPTSGGAHTPEEWVDLQSFGKMYRFLLVVLAACAKS